MSERLLVTGSTGFLGSVLVRRLVERGYSVHALARETSDRSILEGLPVQWHEADIADASAVRRVFEELAGEGSFSVIHAAALISYDRRHAELQRRINVDGTRHVVDACCEFGVRRLLHVSSVVTIAHGSHQEARGETARFNGATLGVDYVTTKREAEELVLARSAELDVVVTNPAAIFGPTERETSNSERLLNEVRSGKRFFAAPPGGISVVGVEDTAEGCVLAFEQGRRGERYGLGESFWSTRDLLSFLTNEYGRPPVRWTLPAGLWSVVLGLVRCVDLVSPRRFVTYQSLRMLALCWNLDSSKARRELDWKPTPAAEVLRSTLHKT